MTHAVVLVRADRSALPDLGGRLSEIDGVAEAYSVTGEWDFVAILRVQQPDDLARVVTERLAEVAGIDRTYTMVAFETYSRHDLEAMFSIGAQ
jgi:DNA-binding Lrp family transcriptional regulator